MIVDFYTISIRKIYDTNLFLCKQYSQYNLKGEDFVKRL